METSPVYCSIFLRISDATNTIHHCNNNNNDHHHHHHPRAEQSSKCWRSEYWGKKRFIEIVHVNNFTRNQLGSIFYAAVWCKDSIGEFPIDALCTPKFTEIQPESQFAQRTCISCI